MLQRQTQLSLSPYSELYDLLIPKDHELRLLNELVDFSFIYDELEDKYCLIDGRNAINPVMMFKYLMLKVMYKYSDMDLVKHAKTDLAMKYFLGLNPEDDVIHPSSLTKFRRQRLQDYGLLNKLIAKTVEIAIEKDVLKSKTIIVDATHTASKYTQKSPVEILRSYSKNVRKAIYRVNEDLKPTFPTKNTTSDLENEKEYTEKLIQTIESTPSILNIPSVSEPFNILKETLDDIHEASKYSFDDSAKIGHKTAASSFFGFKTHIAMTDERIITAATVTTGEESDGKYLRDLVYKSQANGVEVQEILGDTAYSGKSNLEFVKEEEIQLISKLHPIISNGSRNLEDEWVFNKDSGMIVCPDGHQAIRKAKTGAKNKSANQTQTYFFDINKCQICPLREGCYKSGAKSKTYSVSILSETHKDQLDFQNSDEFKEKAKNRYMIEAKNSEIKIRHGYNVSWSKGITNMRLQGAITLFTVNLKRILKLIGEK